MWFTFRPDALTVWQHSIVKKLLRRYYGILKGERIAKYLIAKKVPINLQEGLAKYNLDQLWIIHEKASLKHKEYILKIDNNEIEYVDLDDPLVSYLDVKIEIVKRILRSCRFCEWQCKVDRTKGEKGVCRVGAYARVSSAFLHMGEEAPLVPSGTIFFSGCPFKCVFCQNYDISQYPETGVAVGPKELAKIAHGLARDGAKNINYVGGDPIPNTHIIIESLKYQTDNITQLWNTDLYATMNTMKLMVDIMDFFLPDFKYGNDKCALRLSKVKNYFVVVSRNHKFIYDNGGEIIIRHLVLPNHIDCCSKPILTWIAENMPNVLVNIMGQYRPEYKVYSSDKYKDIQRRPTRSEMEEVFDFADRLGIHWKPVS